ncbi:MAG: hypothetical protein ACR2IE_11840 [Candidatus Sumerlaeaceae bacterium]
MKKRVILMLAGLGLASSACAALFDNSAGGPAVATVGTAADYISLADAASSFSAVAGGINRDWTLQINNSTSETANSFFGNTFGASGKLTIKPAVGTTPIIHFTNLVAGAGVFGHMVIGTSSAAAPTSATVVASNNNYVIDGSNTVGGTTRDLTFLVTGNGNQNNMVSVFGDNEGVVIKNAIWQMNDNTGSVAGVRFVGGLANNPGGIPVIPDNGVVTNNLFNSPSSNNGFGIQTGLGGNGTVPAGAGAVNNLTITDNDFFVRQRGVFLNGIGSTTVARNNFTIGSSLSTAGFVYTAIFPLNNNTTTGWTHTYADNDIRVENLPSIAGQGLNSIFIDALTTGTFNIRNNAIKSSITQATTQSGTLMGISMASPGSVYNIEHNSIDVKSTNSLGLASQQVGAIVGRVATNPGGSFNIRNNILRTDATGTTAAVISLASGPLTSSGNNLVKAGPTSHVGIVGGTGYPDLASWQAAGFDLTATGGQSVDPTTTVPPWNSELRFANKPFGMQPVASSTVLTDIDGDARPATNATPGADEPPSLANVFEWSLM